MPDKSNDFNRAAGDRLRQCRQFLGYTQEQFAEALGVSQTVYDNWETGDNCPRPEKIANIWRSLRITFDWVYAGDAYLLPDDMKKAVAAPKPVTADESAAELAKRRKRA